MQAIPEDIPLDVVYEDRHVIIVNKVGVEGFSRTAQQPSIQPLQGILCWRHHLNVICVLCCIVCSEIRGTKP